MLTGGHRSGGVDDEAELVIRDPAWAAAMAWVKAAAAGGGMRGDGCAVSDAAAAEEARKALTTQLLRQTIAHAVFGRADVGEAAARGQYGAAAWCDADSDPTRVNLGLWRRRMPLSQKQHCAACAQEPRAGENAALLLRQLDLLLQDGDRVHRDIVQDMIGLSPIALASCDWEEATVAVRPVDGEGVAGLQSAPRFCTVTAAQRFAAWQRVELDACMMAPGVVPADAICVSCWSAIASGTLHLLPVLCLRDAERGWDVLYCGRTSLVASTRSDSDGDDDGGDADSAGGQAVWGGGPWMPLREGAWVWQSAAFLAPAMEAGVASRDSSGGAAGAGAC